MERDDDRAKDRSARIGCEQRLDRTGAPFAENDKCQERSTDDNSEDMTAITTD